MAITDESEQMTDEGTGEVAETEATAPAEGATAAPEEAAAEASTEATEAAEKPAKAKKERPQWKAPPKDRLDGALEAILLAAGDVLKLNRLRDLLGVPSRTIVRESIARVAERWTKAGLAVEIEEVAKGVRVVTRPEYAEYVGRLRRRPLADKLTKSLLETLSIVAYKQPAGRAEIERIRGVQAGEALRGLLERGLLKVVGRSDQPGRPLLYGTTDRFLTVFGLKDLKDLPSHGDLKRM